MFVSLIDNNDLEQFLIVVSFKIDNTSKVSIKRYLVWFDAEIN